MLQFWNGHVFVTVALTNICYTWVVLSQSMAKKEDCSIMLEHARGNTGLILCHIHLCVSSYSRGNAKAESRILWDLAKRTIASPSYQGRSSLLFHPWPFFNKRINQHLDFCQRLLNRDEHANWQNFIRNFGQYIKKYSITEEIFTPAFYSSWTTA